MPKKILIVDDSAINRRILRGGLSKQYDVAEAASGEEARDILARDGLSYSAVLLDIVMPGMNGFDVLSWMRADAELSGIPVIMITGSEEEEVRVKSLALGANDFVIKPYNPDIIRHCLRNNIALRETASLIRKIERDRLTGLYAREAFFERAEDIVRQAEPGSYVMSCFDINNFKFINDQYGAAEGDRILRFIGQTVLKDMESVGGIGCRIAADNFAALYPATELNSGYIARIQESAHVPEILKSSTAFSVGRYIVTDPALSAAALYDRADLAKRSVKGRYDKHIAYFDEAMRDKLVFEQQIISEMDQALSDHQFEAWFQPQYNSVTGALIGAEALARWRHPQRGMIPPGAFIPIFEQNGFVYELDKEIWEQSCRYLRKWIDEGRSPLPVSVNISRCDVFRPDLVETITGLIRKYALTTELLRLEITESAFSQSAEQIIAVVERLLDAGFTVEIDDFGSGYSSLNTLKDVPAQIIKLDMKFLENSNAQRGGNVVESVVRMAKWLNMSVIAEGVETQEQADFLRSVGCCYIQGYFCNRPMAAADYEALFTGADREERLLALETIKTLDNNVFWDPKSMDTLIFNSYVGGACIIEYHNGVAELIRANDKYAQVLGIAYNADDALASFAPERNMDAENLAILYGNIHNAIRTGEESVCEVRSKRGDGDGYSYLRSTMRPIARAGDHWLVYCSVINITQQREAEQQLSVANERFRAMMNDIGAGIMAAIPDGRALKILFANERFYSMQGFTCGQYQAEVRNAYARIHSGDRRKVLRALTAVYSAGQPAQIECRMHQRDGAERWVRIGLSCTRFSGIDRNVILCIFSDVTAEKQAGQELRNATAQMELLMDDTPGGFCRIRIHGDGSAPAVAYLNEGCCELMGMTRAEAMAAFGANPFGLIHPEDEKAVEAAIHAANGGQFGLQCRLRHGAEEYRPVQFNGRLIRSDSGVSYLNAYFSDLSDRIGTEAQRRELLDNLPYGAGLYEYDGAHLTVLHLNRRYWELVGRSGTKYGEAMDMEAVHPEDRPLIQLKLTAAIRGANDLNCDIRILCGDGAYRSFRLAGRMLAKGDGIYLIYVAFTQISDEALAIQEMLPVVLKAMMASQNDFTFVKDRSLRYVCCSRAFARMVGLADETQIVGKTDWELFDASLAEAYIADDRRLMESGESLIDHKERIPGGGGSARYANTSKYLLHDSRGNIIGLYGIGRDITVSMKKDSQLQLLTDTIPGGIASYLYTRDGVRVLYCNDGFCRLFGGSRAGFEARGDLDPLEWVFREDLPALRSQIERMLLDGTPVDCVFRIHVLGGGYKWINHKAVESERRGDQVVVNAVLLDVTERQETIEQLRISEEENRLAILHSGNVVCRYTIADRSLTTSPEAAERFGRSERIEDVPYGPVRSGKIAPESAETYIRFYEEILRGEKSGGAVFRTETAHGLRWLDAHYSTVFSNTGEPVAAVVSFIDVTEQQEKEAVYKRWQQSLQGREKASYSLFRCNVSKNSSFDSEEGALLHIDYQPDELTFDERTFEYAAQCVFPEDRERYIAFLKSDTLLARYYRGKRSDVLEFRELQEDGVRWLRLSVDLVEYPNSADVEAYLMFENINDTKRTELQTKELAEMDALTGVLNRAVFAARVDERMKNAKPGVDHALLMLDIDGFKQVNDVFGHGVGDQTLIDLAASLRSVLRRDDLLGRLGGDEFLIFLNNIPDEQVAARRAKQICALTRKSLSANVQISGSIGIAVAPRDGDTFDALYKRVDAALYRVKDSGKDNFAFYCDELTCAQGLDSEAKAGASSRKRRMLIVDDNKIDQDLLANLFQDEFAVEKAKDGSAALIRLRHYGSAISVVLLDLMMPGMDGFTLLEKMQSTAELQAIPVIVVSVDVDRDTFLHAIAAGASDFVTKPIDHELLRIRVQAAINKSENERQRVRSSFAELQGNEAIRYKTVLERTGTVVVEYDWMDGSFVYDPDISRYLAGTYDSRRLWRILLSDMVTDARSVKLMQGLVHEIAQDRVRMEGSIEVPMRSATGGMHLFQMTVYKIVNEFELTDKFILTFRDTGKRPNP